MVARFGRHRLLALSCGLLAALTVAAPATASPAAATRPGAVGTTATTPQTINRAGAAAGWLARQLVDGERFEVVFDGVAYPDQGLTLDAVLAFAAARTADEAGARALAWATRPDVLAGYTGDGTVESYVGATAKLALAVQVRGGDPASVGGTDLIARLRSLQASSGRFADRSAYGDYSNTLSQSFAILALHRSVGGVPASAASYLAGIRCADGGYPLQPEQPTCTSDVDATALAVQALRAAGRTQDATPGLNWLISVQQSNGGFQDGFGTTNANSTGLAGQALRDGGRPVGWLRAKVWLVTTQSGCAAASTERGAVDYDGGTFDPGTAVRATAQATLGLAGAGFATLSAAGAQPAAPVLACW